MSLYEGLVRPALFALDAERAHALAAFAARAAAAAPGGRGLLRRALRFEHPSLRTRVAGLDFDNPVGLAAGFDKEARLSPLAADLGLGFAEAGTVTPRPQAGLPRPRLWRVPEAGALVNRLGFPGPGAAAVAERLGASGGREARRPGREAPIGVNLGPNADAAPERAAGELAGAVKVLRDSADFWVVNVSSPNTPSLRELARPEALSALLKTLRAGAPGGPAAGAKPFFVKLSPDLGDEELGRLVPVLLELADGVVAGNTTRSREGLPKRAAGLEGGLSGAPLKAAATRLVRRVFRATGGKLPIIGVGGIAGAADAFEKILAGASLVEVYTGLVYRGPGLVREINEGLARLLAERGFKSVAEAVGAEAARPGAVHA